MTRCRSSRAWLRSLGFCFAVWLGSAAEAVVISSGDGTGNTTPPTDDFGFANVGATLTTNLSGIYLGDGWVLTANHVGAQPIRLNGATYQPVPGSGVRLTNTSGPPPDLYVYRINGFPALPPVVLSSATPVFGEAVSCAGHGWTRQASTTTWNSSWQEQPPPVYKGFKAQGSSARRWGTNLVTAVGNTILDTRAIETIFDEIGGTTHESQVVVGDSGGGCFAKRNGTWELVGVIYAMLVFNSQPGNVTVFGNATIAADVAFYRTQIETLTPPPGSVPALPAAGAFALAALIVLAARGLRAPRLSSGFPTRR